MLASSGMDKKLLLCLIVDDEPLAQQILENYILRIEELELVAKCESVEEAFGVLKSNHIDIVFLDLQLQAVNGSEVVKKLKSLHKGQCFIIITSATSRSSLKSEKIFNDEHVLLVDYLTKPFSFERFRSAIDKILQRHERFEGKR